MSDQKPSITIVGADVSESGLIVHFSNEVSALYHPDFLYDVREDDGNVPLSNTPNEDSKEAES